MDEQQLLMALSLITAASPTDRKNVPSDSAVHLELGLTEEKDLEFKSARGGIPGSLWETYSAMANTDGGTIVLGVEEKDGRFNLTGLEKPSQIRKNFWSIINNRGKVSTNLLRDEDVFLKKINEKTVLIVRVPRATRRQRPV